MRKNSHTTQDTHTNTKRMERLTASFTSGSASVKCKAICLITGCNTIYTGRK